jgi:chromosome segregation ATPase
VSLILSFRLQQVEAERANAVKKSSSIHNKVEETREQLKEKEKELKALSKQLDALSKEKAVVEGQKEEAIQTGAKAEIDVREAKARIDSEKEEKVSHNNYESFRLRCTSPFCIMLRHIPGVCFIL